jgi:arsenate reductase
MKKKVKSKVEAKDGGTILFVCTGNACRSQMAEGFGHEMLHGWRVLSAGTIAAGVNATAKRVMEEIGIDISSQYSKAVDEIPIEEVDYVVTLCGDAKERCPTFPNAGNKEHWPIDDPIYSSGTDREVGEFRRARDDIRGRMEKLAKKLTA